MTIHRRSLHPKVGPNVFRVVAMEQEVVLSFLEPVEGATRCVVEEGSARKPISMYEPEEVSALGGDEAALDVGCPWVIRTSVKEMSICHTPISW